MPIGDLVAGLVPVRLLGYRRKTVLTIVGGKQMRTLGVNMRESRDSGRSPDGLFISYRRGATTGQARALHDRLALHFGADRVFMDVDSIAPGTDFVEKVKEAIGASRVVLVLIGADWLGRTTGTGLVDDPDDFVRLEVDTALQHKIPTIPILVERTPMPAPEALPESLRSLARLNALELENSRWEYDVSRLRDVLEPLVGGSTAAAKPAPKLPSARTPRFSRRTLAGAAGGLLAAIVIVALALTFFSGSSSPHPSLSAAKAVAAAQPDRLVDALLNTGFAQNDVPSGASASPAQVQNVREPGLVAATYIPLPGPAASIQIHYYVFDNQGEASSFFANASPVPTGYKAAGRFTATGISDPVKCASGQAATLSAKRGSGCLTLSSRVVGFTAVFAGPDNSVNADQLATALARDAIRHLQSVASRTRKAALPPPPGPLTPSALYNQLDSSSFNPSWLPAILASPTVQALANGSTSPAGLFDGSRIQIAMRGPDDLDYISFFVFGSAQEAESFFASNLSPTGFTRTGTTDSTGFPQQAQCGTFDRTASKTLGAATTASCYVLWGNVIVQGATQTNAITTIPDDNLAVTLARMGIIYLGERD
jgi:TIR domain